MQILSIGPADIPVWDNMITAGLPLWNNMLTTGIPLWKQIVTAGFLIPAFVTDIKEKKILLIPCIIGTLIGIVAGFLIPGGAGEAFEGMIPGAILIVLSRIFKGALGAGDGMILMMIGSFLGLRRSVAVLFAALVLSMAAALVLLAARKVDRKTQFPFVPFLCLGFLITAFL